MVDIAWKGARTLERASRSRDEIRRQNRVSILEYLRVNGPCPRTDIAQRVHLTKAAVTALTNDMIAGGELVEKGELLSRELLHQRGRRKVLLDINENCRLAFGIVVEGESLQVGLTNLKGQTLDRLELPLESCTYRRILELVVENVTMLTRNNCIPAEQILGMGCCLSRSGETHVEGASPADKLVRLKRDLSHALSMPIVIASTIGGALLAQKLFGDGASQNMMMIRYGKQIEAALTVNGRIYRGFSNRAGGFTSMQQMPEGTSYDLCAGSDGMEDGSNLQLNRKLAKDVGLCRTVLDPERIYGFGSYFETEFALPGVNRLLEEHQPQRVLLERSLITEATAYLAGCAAAIEELFYCTPVNE